MKKTIDIQPIGIIRSIDEFGRIAIPKEIRRSLKINSDDPVEIIPVAGGILLRLYVPEEEEV